MSLKRTRDRLGRLERLPLSVDDDVIETLSEIDSMSEAQSHFVIRFHKWHESDGDPECDRCHSFDCIPTLRNVYVYQCRSCKYQFSATTKTVFEKSSLSYNQILKAIVLAELDYVTIKEVQEDLSVSHATATKMQKRIFHIRDTGTIWK